MEKEEQELHGCGDGSVMRYDAGQVLHARGWGMLRCARCAEMAWEW